MKKLSIICMTVLAVFAMASCRGPMGPQGPAGHDGNANVASSTLTVYPNNWEWDRLFTDGQGHERGRYIVTIDYPAINNNVYNYGAVLVYMDVEGTWSQVPQISLSQQRHSFLKSEKVIQQSKVISILDNNEGRSYWLSRMGR